MAVDLCQLGMERNDEGGDGKNTSPEQPTATGDAAIFKKGAWSKEEDEKLKQSVDKYGLRNWVAVEKYSGLGRPAKNCRLRWLNYLRPNLKKYPFTQEEEDLIFELHSKYGNSWSRIASKLPGRSDNEIKNFWHKRSNKRHKHQHQQIPIYPTTNTTTQNNSYKANENDENDPTPTPSSFSTPPSPSTPQPQPLSCQTSQTQNLLISPNPTTQSIPIFSRNPPILLSPHGRFSRARSESSPNSAHCPTVPNEPSFLPQDSSLQPRFSSSAMESPRSPLKLNLCSAQMNTQATMDSQTACFSGFQLQSPAAPLSPLPSPLKLRLSIPMPSEFSFQSSLPNPNPSVQFGQDWPTFQHTAVDTTDKNVIHQNSSPPPTIETEPSSIQVESDNSFEIMKELREAQARVEFLKEKLKVGHVSNKRNSSTNDSTQGTLDGNSNECTLYRSSSATENFLTPRVRITPHKIKNITRKGDNMEWEKKTYQNENLKTMQIEESSMSFQEQRHSIDFLDHLNMHSTVNVNTPSSDCFINKQCHFQGHECSSTTDSLYTLGPIDQGIYFNYSFGQEISDTLMDDGGDGVLGVKTMFDEDSNLNFLETSSLVSAPIAEQEYFGSEQFSLQTTPGSGNFCQSPAANFAANLIENLVDSICCPPQSEEHFVQGPSREQSSMMQGLMVDDNLWSQEQTHFFSTNKFHDQMESKNWNNVLSWDDAQKHVEVEQDHINTMSEELSSLLDFFPTTNQTLDWCNIRTPDTKKLLMSSTCHQHPTHN